MSSNINKTQLIKDAHKRLKLEISYYSEISSKCRQAKENVLTMHSRLVCAVDESLGRALAEITDLEKDAFTDSDRHISALQEVLVK